MLGVKKTEAEILQYDSLIKRLEKDTQPQGGQLGDPASEAFKNLNNYLWTKKYLQLIEQFEKKEASTEGEAKPAVQAPRSNRVVEITKELIAKGFNQDQINGFFQGLAPELQAALFMDEAPSSLPQMAFMAYRNQNPANVTIQQLKDLVELQKLLTPAQPEKPSGGDSEASKLLAVVLQNQTAMMQAQQPKQSTDVKELVTLLAGFYTTLTQKDLALVEQRMQSQIPPDMATQLTQAKTVMEAMGIKPGTGTVTGTDPEIQIRLKEMDIRLEDMKHAREMESRKWEAEREDKRVNRESQQGFFREILGTFKGPLQRMGEAGAGAAEKRLGGTAGAGMVLPPDMVLLTCPQCKNSFPDLVSKPTHICPSCGYSGGVIPPGAAENVQSRTAPAESQPGAAGPPPSAEPGPVTFR